MRLSRRALLTAAAGAPLISAGAVAGGLAAAKRPVVSLHQDRPYIDFTGEAEPFVPPATSAGLKVAALEEERLRWLAPFG